MTQKIRFYSSQNNVMKKDIAATIIHDDNILLLL